MSSYELTFSEERPQRNFVNGRFLKGSEPHNKGKKWDEYMSKEGQERAKKGWKNMHRQEIRPANSGRPRRAVIALVDGRPRYIKDIATAGRLINGRLGNVQRCCAENKKNGYERVHTYKGIAFFYEDDDTWQAFVKKS